MKKIMVAVGNLLQLFCHDLLASMANGITLIMRHDFWDNSNTMFARVEGP